MKKISILATFALTAISAFADIAVYPEAVLGTDYILSDDKCTATLLTVNALAHYQALPNECGGNPSFKLGADIKVGESVPTEECTTNLEIYNTGLRGNFDGDGHTISNVCIKNEYSAVSLFGSAGSDLSIKNLTVDGIYVYSGAKTGNTSALIGDAGNNLTISNVKVRNATVNSSSTNVGGLLAWTKTGSTVHVENSSYEGTIKGTYEKDASEAAIGGLVGLIEGKAYVISSYFKGEIIESTQESKANIGGLIGKDVDNDSLTIEKCYATNTMVNSDQNFLSIALNSATGFNIGGFIGHLQSVEYVLINEGFAKGVIKVSGAIKQGVNPGYSGGIVGWDNNNNWYMLSNLYYMGGFDVPGDQTKFKVYGITSAQSTLPNYYYPSGTGNINGNVRASFAYDSKGRTNIVSELQNKNTSGVGHLHGQYTVAATTAKNTPVTVTENSDLTQNTEKFVLASEAFATLLEKYDENDNAQTWFYDANLNDGFPSLVNVPSIEMTITIEGIAELTITGIKTTTKTPLAETTISEGSTVVPSLSAITFVGAKGSFLEVTFNETTRIVEYGKELVIPSTVSSLKVEPISDIYSITTNTSDIEGVVYKSEEYPTGYSFKAPVSFPVIANINKCFTGWTLTDELGTVIASLKDPIDNAFTWDPEDTHTDIIATPTFSDKKCNVNVVFTDNSKYGVEWAISNSEESFDVVPVETNKFSAQIPNLAGISYSVTLKTTDNSESVTSVKQGTTIITEMDGKYTFTYSDADVNNIAVMANVDADFYYVTWLDDQTIVATANGLGSSLSNIKDSKGQDIDNAPMGDLTEGTEASSITYWTTFVGNNIAIWSDQFSIDNDQTFYKTTANIAFAELPEGSIWNGSDFSLLSAESMPSVIFVEDGQYKISESWTINSSEMAFAKTDDIKEFVRMYPNIAAEDGVILTLATSEAKDYNMTVHVTDVEAANATCEIFGKTYSFEIKGGEGNLPQCAVVTFESNEQDSLHILIGSDTVAVAYGDPIKVPEGTTELGVAKKPEEIIPEDPVEPEDPTPVDPGKFSIQNMEFALSGHAVRVRIASEINSELPVSLSVRILSATDSVVVDSLLTDSTATGIQEFEYYPLASGKYYAEATLAGAKDTVSLATEDWTIDSVAAVLAAGEWNMVSLAQIDESFKIPAEDKGYVYYWDEDKPIGDYWQYKSLSSVEDIQKANGYWLFVEDTTLLMASKNPTAKSSDSISWELKNNFSGWNMIANPYSWKVKLNSVAFADAENADQPFWRWNPKTAEYEIVNVLDENAAVWIKTAEARTLTVDAKPVYATAQNDSVNKPMANAKSSWSLRLKLQGENGKTDSWNVVGVGSREVSIDEPPTALASGVSLAILDGNKKLAKAIKNTNEDASWNVAFKASNLQKANVSVEGLEQLEKLGLYATLTVDGVTTPLAANENVELTLSTTSKNATLNVQPIGTIAKSVGIRNLRYALSGNMMNLSFELPASLAGKNLDVRLVDVHGKTISMSNDKASEGTNKAALSVPTMSGMFFLRVNVAEHSKTVKVKF